MRIPVTGIGVVGPGAVGVEQFRALLRGGRTAVKEIDRFDTSALRSHRAGLVREFKPRDFIPPMKLRRMNALSKFGVAAARLAIEDSRGTPPPDAGVAIGTSFGPVQTSVEYLQAYVERGAALAPPQLFAESVANAPGSHIAIEWGLRGFNLTVTQRESSALSAAMVAAMQILKEGASSALIGGVEEVNEMLYSVLERLGALAHQEDGREEAARPFDRRRNGFVLGEGAAVLVANFGSRRPYGWLSGFGLARDASASISDWGSDETSVVRAMQAAIDDAGITVEEIDAIHASANGSLRGDDLEARAIRTLFGERIPPVVATKGFFGEYAAGGALQLAAALLAIEDQQLYPAAGFEEGELPVNRELTDATIRHTLISSVSAGGGILCAVLSREGA